MPMTSTKNLRLSSGLGESSSMWPRWARSKIGSVVMLVSYQRPRHVVEQLIDGKFARDELLLRGVTRDQFERLAHLVGRISRRGAGGLVGTRQQVMNFPH